MADVFLSYSRRDSGFVRRLTAALQDRGKEDAERVGAQALVEKNLDRALLLGVLGVGLQDRVQTRSDLLAVLQQNFAAIRMFRPLGTAPWRSRQPQ